MAVEVLICPQCGANIKKKTDKTISFCMYCGAALQFHEVIEVHHTIDNSRQGRNRRNIADRAFFAGNYEEAYEKYTSALEDIGNDFVCLYRKAVTGVYVSFNNTFNRREFVTYMKEACDENEKTKKLNKELYHRYLNQMESDLKALSAYCRGCATVKSNACKRESDCAIIEDKWRRYLDLTNAMLPYVKSETALIFILQNALEFCNCNMPALYVRNGLRNMMHQRPDDLNQYVTSCVNEWSVRYEKLSRRHLVDDTYPYQ